MCVLTRYVVNWWFGCGHAFRCSMSAWWFQGFQDQTVGYVLWLVVPRVVCLLDGMPVCTSLPNSSSVCLYCISLAAVLCCWHFRIYNLQSWLVCLVVSVIMVCPLEQPQCGLERVYSQTQLCQLRCFNDYTRQLHVSDPTGHLQVVFKRT